MISKRLYSIAQVSLEYVILFAIVAVVAVACFGWQPNPDPTKKGSNLSIIRNSLLTTEGYPKGWDRITALPGS